MFGGGNVIQKEIEGNWWNWGGNDAPTMINLPPVLKPYHYQLSKSWNKLPVSERGRWRDETENILQQWNQSSRIGKSMVVDSEWWRNTSNTVSYRWGSPSVSLKCPLLWWPMGDDDGQAGGQTIRYTWTGRGEWIQPPPPSPPPHTA